MSDDKIPVTAPDVLAGMLAITLDKAMQRLHNGHTPGPWTEWTTCTVSTLCRNAAGLFEAPETQLAIASAYVAARGLQDRP